MPETASDAGNSVDVRALFAQLQEEVRRAGPAAAHAAGASSTRLNARSAAERLWPVSSDRHIGGRAGALGLLQRPVKLVVRKLTRWYVEPVFADQRGVNDAVLKLIDDLYAEVDRLNARIRELESRP
jgi:hypothetical protein